MAQMQLIQNGTSNWRIVTPVVPGETERNEAFFADMEKLGIGKFHEGATMAMNRDYLMNTLQGGRV